LENPGQNPAYHPWYLGLARLCSFRKIVCLSIKILYYRVSLRLAYHDLSLERKRQDERMKNMDPKKKEQAERLGMGYGSNR
jgi:hypothetical protein